MSFLVTDPQYLSLGGGGWVRGRKNFESKDDNIFSHWSPTQIYAQLYCTLLSKGVSASNN